MKRKILLGSFILLSVSSYAKPLVVELPGEGIALEYSQPVRLDRVLADSIAQSKQASPVVYPLSNQLFDSDKEGKAQQLKAKVLDQLQTFANTHSEWTTSVQLLIEQIKRWDIGYREFTSLDYDVIRLKTAANPMMSGEFELIIPQRNEHISVEGLLFRPQSVPFNPAYHLSDYLENVTPLSSADNSQAWVIYPDGQTFRSGYEYFNNERRHLAPGSVIFLGFGSDEPQLVDLERDIVKLISMRKGL